MIKASQLVKKRIHLLVIADIEYCRLDTGANRRFGLLQNSLSPRELLLDGCYPLGQSGYFFF